MLYFFLLSATAIFSHCLEMPDSHILPKWLGTLGVLALIGMVEGVVFLFGKQSCMKELPPFIMVALFCTSQAVYAIVQACGIFPSNFSYQIVGSFDNPAGLAACLSVGTPCCIYLYRRLDRKALKRFMAAMVILIGVALFLSESRTGILVGLFFPMAWWLLGFIKKRWMLTVLLGVGVFLMSAMYIAKKDSADGRLLMFYCGWEMIKERPLFGYGVDGIQAHYMEHQAKWLAEHPKNGFTMLADNVKSVFNEYLTIGICFGIVGWLAIGAFIWLMIHCYRKSPSKEGYCALMSLAIIGGLSCFSYPLSYPFTWIILVWDSYILFHQAYPVRLKINNSIRCITAVFLFGFSSFLLYSVVKRTRAELEWGQVARMALMGKSEEVFPRYKMLMSVLGNEPYFLYNYAAELYLAKRYEESLHIAKRCRMYWADYDLELLHGELFYELGQYEESEHHFQLAANMCPVRFIPIYKLYLLYKDTGDKEKALQMGIRILNKTIKVDSNTIWNIKRDIKRDLAL